MKLKRIYIKNYKTCVDFELELDSINLFMGSNGTGKSTVFEVLQKLHTRSGLIKQDIPLLNTDALAR